MRSRKAGLDPWLLGSVLLLLGVGAFMVYSASLVVAFTELKDDTYFLLRQLIWITIGLGVMAFFSQVDYRRWQRYSLLLLILGLIFLVLVLIPGLGARSYGSARWLRPVPFMQFQPSEFIKLALVIYMADWLAKKEKRVGEFFYSSLPFLIVLSVVCWLVVIEPDFGTTVIIAATAIAIFFIAGANLLHFCGGLLLTTGVFYTVMTQAAYRNERIKAWLDPFEHMQGAGWHTVQTLIALGSGGLTGVGLGASRQKHAWLVNAHTDAILGIIGEELGFVGTAFVLLLFGIVVWRGVRIAYRCGDQYGRLVAAGLTTMIFLQCSINIAVITNSVPYTGVTLPFISFGGSSMVVSMAGVGLLLSIARFQHITPRHLKRETLNAAEENGRPRRRRRDRAAAEPVLASVGKLESPIPISSIRRGGARAN